MLTSPANHSRTTSPPLSSAATGSRRRETMIALRACHEAFRIATDILYARPLDVPPPTAPAIPEIPTLAGPQINTRYRQPLPRCARVMLAITFVVLLVLFIMMMME